MSKVVVTRSIPEAGLAPLRAAHDVEVHQFEPGATEAQLVEAVADADALLCLLSDAVTAPVFEAGSRLKVVAQYAVGYDNIDVEAARAHDVAVTNTPGVLTDATADFAFALLLAVARRIPEADRFVREGHFRQWETQALLGMELAGKTLGIVGMGRIGMAMARRALGFGMQVIYHSRQRANLTLERHACARYVTMDELLEESDVVSLHCALNEASRHLLDAGAFRRMKPTALLINTARGAVVDEPALVSALESGEIAGAGLDVFEDEPAVHPGLLEHPRVVVAPHVASATVEARTAMARMCSESILAALNGDGKIPYRVA